MGLADNLSTRNTLRLMSEAEHLVSVSSSVELDGLLRDAPQDGVTRVLGEGSNVILHDTLPGTTIVMAIEGREVISDDGQKILLRAGAGENWHSLVLWCHHQGFHGLANLALIPGSVGAAPIQNIGAYGVEVAQWIHGVHATHRRTGRHAVLTPDECDFRYRDSVFKHAAGEDWIITAVDFQLSRDAPVEADYPSLRARLTETEPTHDAVLASVMAIRRERLPDPVITPNVGSFFKNPIVAEEDVAQLRATYPELPVFAAPEGKIKISAAWLIDQLGWRGREQAGVRVSADHALVLEGCGARLATPWLALSDAIAESVKETFGIVLELEPIVMGVSMGCADDG